MISRAPPTRPLVGRNRCRTIAYPVPVPPVRDRDSPPVPPPTLYRRTGAGAILRGSSPPHATRPTNRFPSAVDQGVGRARLARHPACQRSAVSANRAASRQAGGISAVARRLNRCKTGHTEAIYPPGSPYVYLLEWQMHRETARGGSRPRSCGVIGG